MLSLKNWLFLRFLIVTLLRCDLISFFILFFNWLIISMKRNQFFNSSLFSWWIRILIHNFERLLFRIEVKIMFIWRSKYETVVVFFLIYFFIWDFRFCLWVFFDLLEIIFFPSYYLNELVLIAHCTLHFFLLCLIPLIEFFSKFLNWFWNYLIIFLLTGFYIFSLIIIIDIIIRLVKLTLCSTQMRSEQTIIYQKRICRCLAKPQRLDVIPLLNNYLFFFLDHHFLCFIKVLFFLLSFKLQVSWACCHFYFNMIILNLILILKFVVKCH